MKITRPLIRLKPFLLKLLIGYAVLVAFLFVMQRSLLYQPFGTYLPPHERGLHGVQELHLPTEDGQNALAWFLPPQEDSHGKVMVYFHGNGGHVGHTSWLLNMMQQVGFGYLALEYRGYPGYAGRTTEQGIYHDARAAMNFITEQGFAADDIVLFGHSLGSGVAVQMATEYDVGLVALVSPFTSVAEAAANIYWYVPARWLVRDRFDSYAKIDRVTAPVYIFHGTEDTLIPFHLGQRLYDRVTAEKRFFDLEGTDHNRIDFAFILQQVAEFTDAQQVTHIPEDENTNEGEPATEHTEPVP